MHIQTWHNLAPALLLATLAAGCQFDRPSDIGDAGTDATDAPAVAVDAPADAPGLAAYDIAYPAEWRMSVSGPATSFIAIVNTGPSPLSLSTFQVTGLSDDHPTAVVRVTSPGSFGDTIAPDNAAGRLSGLAEALLISSGLVMEPWSVRTTDFLSLELLNTPPGTYDIAVNLTVELDGRPASLPMTIHVVPGPTIYLDPLVGRRLTVYR